MISRCSGPGEIFSGHEFYDYTAKYSDGGVSQTETGTASVTTTNMPSSTA